MTLALKRHLERIDHNKSVTRSNTAETPIIPDNMRDHRESFKKFRKFKPITNKKPPVGSTLRTYLDNIKDLLTPNELQQNNKDNITKQERLAIKTLAENTAIVINKADKGSTIVVLDRQHYIAEGNKHLSDTNTYRPLTLDITSQTKDKINRILTQMKKDGFLTTVYTDYCRPPSEHRTSRLYFLKKIHKNPMGIRPIVSSTNSITENISAFVDHWLQPFVNKLSSHIKDTNEFIKLIENTKVPTNCLLVSIDVSSLYTNIPHSEGKAAAVDYLSTNTSDPVQPEPEVIGELISLVLENNVFEFNDKHYLQTQGTAMGTKMAPAYANLFMGKIEIKLQAMTDKIFIWKRFIDDIFIIWTGTNMELEQIIHKANSDATLKQVFPEPPMVAHKKNPSLANKLVRSKLKCITHEPTIITRSQTRSNSQGRLNADTEQTTHIQTRNLFHKRTITRPCGERNCLLCARLTDTCFILSKTHKRRHYIRYVGPTITCTTQRVVYLIRCKRCNKQYVGQTRRQLRHRISDHLKSIDNKKDNHAVPLHFRKKSPKPNEEFDPHTPNDLEVIGLDTVHSSYNCREAEKLLKEIETEWICKLGSLRPVGMNYNLFDNKIRS